jgi:Transposase
MARPSKYTAERAAAVVAGVAAGLTDKDAALAAGIGESTLARWRARFGGFDDRLARARAERTAGWLERIAELAGQTRDWRAYAELLDRCAPEYRKTTVHEHVGEGGGPIRHEHELLAAAVRRVAEEQGLDPAVVLAEAEALLSGEAG